MQVRNICLAGPALSESYEALSEIVKEAKRIFTTLLPLYLSVSLFHGGPRWHCDAQSSQTALRKNMVAFLLNWRVMYFPLKIYFCSKKRVDNLYNKNIIFSFLFPECYVSHTLKGASQEQSSKNGLFTCNRQLWVLD